MKKPDIHAYDGCIVPEPSSNPVFAQVALGISRRGHQFSPKAAGYQTSTEAPKPDPPDLFLPQLRERRDAFPRRIDQLSQDESLAQNRFGTKMVVIPEPCFKNSEGGLPQLFYGKGAAPY